MARTRLSDEEQPGAPLEEPLLGASADGAPAAAAALPVTHLAGGATGVAGCTVLLSKAIVGAGAAALPMAFARLGVVVSVAFLMLIAFMTHFSLEALTAGMLASGAPSYPSAVAALLGPRPALFLELCLVARCAGLIIVYIVIAADLLAGSAAHALPGLLCEIVPGSGGWCGDRRLVAGALTAAVLAPLVAPRRISSARWSSFAGLAAVGLWTVVTGGLAALAAARGGAHVPSLLPDPATLGGDGALEQLTIALSTLPILGTAFTAQMTIGFIASELRGFSAARMARVSAGAVGVTSGVFLIVGLGSIVAFGTDLPADVLEKFGRAPLGALVGPGAAAALGAAVRFGFLLSILANMPFQMLPYRQSLARLTLGGDAEFGGAGYVVVTYASLALFYAVAMAAKSIWVPIQLVGATAGAAIAFFYPAALALAVAGDDNAPGVSGGYYRANAWALVAAGAVQVVTGTTAVWLETGKGGGDGGNGLAAGLRWPAL